ncbi:MAG: AraC family transcriptional regulator [Pseudomonadota bacterium]
MPHPSKAYEDRLRRVIDYIYDHADEDLSLDTLADVAAMSRFHWHRVFRAMTGETCAQAVRRVRLQRAGFLLARSDAPIASIARACGLGGQAAFSRAFAEAYGVPPARFRAEGQMRPMAFTPSQELTQMFDVTIETKPDMRMAAYAHKGDYTQIARAFEQFSAVASARGLWPQVEGMMGIYYDDPSTTPEAELRSHAGALLAPGAEVPEGLEEITIAGSRMARLRLKGPYTGLPAAYNHLYGPWLQASGEEPSDAPSFELYINSPMDTAPDELLTDIYMPLKS